MNRFTLSRRHQMGKKRPARARPVLELLEERTVLSSYMAATVTDLVNDIKAANAAQGTNTIALVAGNTFTVTAVDNTTDYSGNGLPVIAANDNLTILGNGGRITRSTASGTPAFRLFDVAVGASLTLSNLTLANGQDAFCGEGKDAYGGGIYSSGSLTLTNVTLSSNSAVGMNGAVWDNGGGGWYFSPGGFAYGGGLYVAGGTATLTNCTISSNSAIGGTGVGPIGGSGGSPGGSAAGGGLYVAGGTVTLTNDTLTSNSAQGGSTDGQHCYAGGGFGGGAFVAGGTVTLTNDTISSNSAIGGAGATRKWNGWAGGGGFYIDSAATVYLDAFTKKHTTNNKPGQIYGSYTLIT